MSSNTRSEFRGNGIALSGAGNLTVGRDVIIGSRLSLDQNNQFLADLRSTDAKDDKTRIERTKGGLLKDSYKWILKNDDFRQWRDNDESRLLWVKGDPGKGKTMLLCGIINELELLPADARILSYFFCQATDGRLNSALAVLRCLIYMLLVQEPSLIAGIRQNYDHAGNQLFNDVNAWDALSKMLMSLLEELGSTQVYLIIDALDECETGLSQLLHLIVQLASSSSAHAKLLVSSRNWLNIEEAFVEIADKTRLSLELHEQSVSRAVGKYIRHKTKTLAHLKKYDDKLKKAVRRHLRLNANNTFLWVALVCQELAKENVRNRHTLARLNTFPSGLRPLYKRMVDQIEESLDASLCKQVLRLMLVAYRPLALTEMLHLLDFPRDTPAEPDTLQEIISLCGSLLTVREGIVYFVHESAASFLTDGTFSWIQPNGKAHEHHLVLTKSLQIMSSTLRRNIFGLKVLGISIDKVRPPDDNPLSAAEYPCIYWVEHFADSAFSKQTCAQAVLSVKEFMEKHLLHWLESVALLRMKSGGIVLVDKLLKTFQGLRDISQDVMGFISDAKRFVLSFWSIIERAPLQTYASSLLFAPLRSEVRQRFSHERWGGLVSVQGLKKEWDAHRQTLEGHDDHIAGIAFSPDGRLLASASLDETIRLWDTTSGSIQHIIHKEVEYPDDRGFFDVTFSPDNQWLAAYTSECICLWSTASFSMRYVLHDKGVTSSAFCPEGRLLALGSTNGRVRLWHISEGLSFQKLRGGRHKNPVTDIIFSMNGLTLASSSSNRTIRIWDIMAGVQQHVLDCDGSLIEVIEFSPDGQLLTSGHSDGTIRVWAVANGTCRQVLHQELKGRSPRIRAISFAPEGSLLATASSDTMVRIWDVTQGTCCYTLEGHSAIVDTVTFSPNGLVIASGSFDGTTRIWDVGTGQRLQIFEGRVSDGQAIVFSPDGQLLASACSGNTIRLWNVETDLKCELLEGHETPIDQLLLSSDGKTVASAAKDDTIQLWTTETGKYQQTLRVQGGQVTMIAFAPEDHLLASACEDGKIQIWNHLTSVHQRTLEDRGSGGNVLAMAFSPDGRKLAVASSCIIHLWDVITGVLLHTLQGHKGYIRKITFSPNGHMMASASTDGTVRLWNTNSGAQDSKLAGHDDRILAVAFSLDGQMVASASRDRTVRLWSVTTGNNEHVCYGHEDSIIAVTFTTDCRSVVSASADDTIRLWDVATGKSLQTLEIGYSCSLELDHLSDSSRLLTDVGALSLAADGSKDVSALSVHRQPRLLPIEFGISPEKDWIVVNSKQMVWIPPEYQPRKSAVQDSTIFLGCYSGRVLGIVVDVEYLRRLRKNPGKGKRRKQRLAPI